MPESAPAGWDMKFVGGGFGDRDLEARCNGCQFGIDHDVLRVAKFKNDAEDLLLQNYPMGGTIVPGKGGTPLAVRERGRAAQSFPNRLIKEHLRVYVLELCTTDAKTSSLTGIRNFIETAVNDTTIVAKVNNYKTRGKLFSEERLAVRQMLSRYWHNSSLFSMELSSAVMRQGSFVDKMHKIDWLHSPTAIATMQRLLVKYDRFFHIMASNPLTTAVPTLDVDLAWHTHQLSPKDYYSYSIQMPTNRFIDHDDKIDEEKLSEGFEWTSKEYQNLYGAVYSECTCWYCEAIRAKHASSTSLFKTPSKHDKIADQFHDSGAAKFCPPDNSAHISTHNAVPLVGDPTTQRITDRAAEARKKQLDEFYEKACKRAIKRGRPVPKKEQFVADHYGMSYASQYPLSCIRMAYTTIRTGWVSTARALQAHAMADAEQGVVVDAAVVEDVVGAVGAVAVVAAPVE
ncbi:hypothetical protein ACLOAV_006504 [Pseudogymnoascus australis]